MLSCPRCGAGYFKEGQLLTMHLTWCCQGPSLLCHAQTGILQTKHSHDQMLSGSFPTTFQQQIKTFNLLRVNVFVPTMKALHGMPSLLHLSSTQSELENSNVRYSGFDIDLSTPAADDQSITNNYPITDPVIENFLFSEKYHAFTP
jgi:hypothetical protein